MREQIKSILLAVMIVLFVISYFFDFKSSSRSNNSDKLNETNIDSELDKVYKTFSIAYDQLDADMVTNLYVADAKYLSGDDAIKEGLENIRSGFQRYFEWANSENASLNISFDIQDRKYSENLVVDVGYYLIETTFPKDSSKETKHSAGKFITVLQPQDNEDWKFIIDGYNKAPVEAFNSE